MPSTALLCAALLGAATTAPQGNHGTGWIADAGGDPYAFLEDVDGERALAWVKARNAESTKELASNPEFQRTRAEILEILDSEARIPYVKRRGALYYNFWRDKVHPRGLWRRTTLGQYRRAEPRWETLVDLDALAAQENENWVWQGEDCLDPAYRQCLIFLSRGGADASVVREFNLQTKAFVPGGFKLPEAKSRVDWLDADHLLVGTDFGPGSMTTSGYPRVSKIWTRGTPLAAAAPLFEGEAGDVSVGADCSHTPGYVRTTIERRIAFFSAKHYLRRDNGTLVPIDVPLDAWFGLKREWMLVKPRSAWTVGDTTYPPGTLLVARFDDYLAGKRELTVLFAPTRTTTLVGWSWTRHHLILNLLDDVASRGEILTPSGARWTHEPLPAIPPLSSGTASGTESDLDDEFFSTVESFLAPATLSRGILASRAATTILKRAPSFFDASGDEAAQYFARSKDGTRVPYFVVRPKGAAAGRDPPTLLSGYGGFESSMTPYYAAAVGRVWHARGGIYVLANIRGGGEYGPEWHAAAMKEHRPRAYEDFAAVAEDLVVRGITSAKEIGLWGGSNGGLLVGNMLTSYPKVFGAAVCAVPLLDMRHYTHYAAGASWIAEYGDPDKPEEWAFLHTFSPYDNANGQVKYPPLLLTTSTRDDRVGPIHARKMAAKLLDFGDDVRLYENIEGGHGAAANHDEAAFMSALGYTFLWKKLHHDPP